MGSAPLPTGAGHGGADRLDQAGVRVAGDQRDAGQAERDQVSEERQPTGTVLGAGDLQPEDLPLLVVVHADRHQRVDVDRAPALTHLQHQRVGGEEGVRAGIQRPGAERLDLHFEIAGHRAPMSSSGVGPTVTSTPDDAWGRNAR